MANNGSYVTSVLTPEMKAELKRRAHINGLSESKMARVYIAKGLETEQEVPTPEMLVQNGMAPNIETATKLFELLQPHRKEIRDING